MLGAPVQRLEHHIFQRKLHNNNGKLMSVNCIVQNFFQNWWHVSKMWRNTCNFDFENGICIGLNELLSKGYVSRQSRKKRWINSNHKKLPTRFISIQKGYRCFNKCLSSTFLLVCIEPKMIQAIWRKWSKGFLLI